MKVINLKKIEKIGKEIIESEIKQKDLEIDQLKKENKAIREEKDFYEDYKLYLKKLIYPWKNYYKLDIDDFEQKSIIRDDPLNATIQIEPPLIPIFFHPLVYRLNFINQFSFSYEYPSATHSRLSHSLGTMANMDRALSLIFRKNEIYSKNGKEEIDLKLKDINEIIIRGKISALIHDIGHGPFSHVVDRFVGFKKGLFSYPDKVFSLIYLRKYLKSLIQDIDKKFSKIDIKYENIEEILDDSIRPKEGYNELIAELLDSALDIDRMDYLRRDSYFSGLKLGIINSNKIIDHIIPYSEDSIITIGYSEDAIPYIRDFLSSRINMYVNCYEHPTKLASERMLIKALEHIYENTFNRKLNLDDIILLTDKQLIDLIISASKFTDIPFKLINLIQSGRIFKLIATYNLGAKRDVIEVKQFLKDRRRRQGERAYSKDVKDLEERIIENSGLPIEDSWKIAVCFPQPESISRTGTGIRIIRKANNGYKACKIEDISKEIKNLIEQMYNERLKIRIFISDLFSKDEKNKIKKTIKNIFK